MNFANGGMNFNRSLDTLPDGQILFGRNIRSPRQGVVGARSGLEHFATIPGKTWVHSISRLNNFSPALNLTHTYLVGADDSIYMGVDEAHLQNTALNPLKLPLFGATTGLLSGKPLTMVDAAPRSGSPGWKYIGDHETLLTVGYYPFDDPDTQMAHAFTMGLPAPPSLTVPAIGSDPGLLNGNYQWRFAYRRYYTGARSNPSPATRTTWATPAIFINNASASIDLPPAPIDPQTGLPDTNIVVDVYRFSDVLPRWVFVGSAPAGSNMVDTTPDSALLSAPGPPAVTDPDTGISRFNLFQPFPVLDIPRKGTGIIEQLPNGVWIIVWQSGDEFNVGWTPGSFFKVHPTAYTTLYQVRQAGRAGAVIELTENLANVGMASGDIVDWDTGLGVLTAGAPMRCIFGLYGTGQSGSYIFGLGNDLTAGTLYWTNGNDPDSADTANSVIVTAPSEPLMGGAIYDGTPYLWSTERMFRVYPSLAVAGQFLVEEIPGGKGLAMPYAHSVHSNGISDQSMTWRSKDGIYDYSGAGLRSLTDATLYPFFSHDNQNPVVLSLLYPWLTGEDTVCGPPITGTEQGPYSNFTQYHNLCWFEGVLFYDYPAATTGHYSTLVYEGRQEPNGWIAFDVYNGVSNRPLGRAYEVAASNLKFSEGNIVYNYNKYTVGDAGNPISCRLVTAAFDAGDPRAQKIWGDAYLDLDPRVDIGVTPRFSPEMDAAIGSILINGIGSGAGSGRKQQVLDLTDGLGRPASSFALDFAWTENVSGGLPSLFYEWEPSWVPKPEITVKRATDWEDEGTAQNKYLYGCLIEADTYNVPRTVEILGDGDLLIATLSIQHDGQQTKPYYFVDPLITHHMRISPRDESAWQLYSVKWFWTLQPELTSFVPDYSPTDPIAYRGVAIEADTGGQDVAVQVISEGIEVRRLTCNHNGRVQKAYSFAEAFTSTEVKLVPLDQPGFPNPPWRQHADWKVRWIGDARPDLAALYSEWTDDGVQAAKFFQGFVLWADTLGQDRTLTVQYDGGQVGGVFTKVNHAGNLQLAYSFPVPFVAHQVRIIPDGPLRYIGPWRIKWIWEPHPDLAKYWITQTTSHGFRGYHSHRDCFVTLQSYSDVKLIVTQDDGRVYTYLIPSTGGEIRKPYEVLQPMKAKLSQYTLLACKPFRVFQKDCAMAVKEWGTSEGCQIVRVHGDLHFKRGARI